jgi:hypothetical protein
VLRSYAASVARSIRLVGCSTFADVPQATADVSQAGNRIIDRFPAFLMVSPSLAFQLQGRMQGSERQPSPRQHRFASVV